MNIFDRFFFLKPEGLLEPLVLRRDASEPYQERLDPLEALLHPSLPGDLGRNGVDGIHRL